MQPEGGRIPAQLRGSDVSRWSIMEGDCRVLLPQLSAASVDAVVCDPPYELGFMGKKWDRTAVAFQVATWEAVLRVLKPGAHLVAFGGTRTYHRMVCAIEDAGFEVRDTLQWIFGTGFPKSLDVAKAGWREFGPWPSPNPMDYECAQQLEQEHAGQGTALKPAYEPIVLARKRPSGTVATNVQEHGTGALNVDACRVETGAADAQAMQRCNTSGSGRHHAGGGMGESFHRSRDSEDLDTTAGRWPPNVLLSHAQGCADQCAVGCAVAELDVQSDTTGSSGTEVTGNAHAHGIYGAREKLGRGQIGKGDIGTASRFFPTFRYEAKAPRAERERGCERLPPRKTVETVQRPADSPGAQSPRSGAGRGAGASRYRCVRCGLHLGGGRAVTGCEEGGSHTPAAYDRGPSVRNHHPTVKPVALMRWLVRLVAPGGARVLDPFAGSGTTGLAVVLEGDGRRFLGIEEDPDYCEIARARLRHCTGEGERPKTELPSRGGQQDLF